MNHTIVEPGHTISSLLASSAVTVDLDPTVFMQLIFFAAFAWVMKDLIFDPLMAVFEERDRRTEGAIGDARGMDEQAIGLKQEYDAKLEDIRREAAVDRERIRDRIKKVESEMTAEARGAVDETLAAGVAKIEAEMDEIRRDLATQRKSLAADIAAKVLGRSVLGGGVLGGGVSGGGVGGGAS